MALAAFLPSVYFNSPLVAGGIGIVVDIGYRAIFRNKDYRVWWVIIGPTCGGQIFFLPIWVWGVVLLFYDYLGYR